MAARVYGQYCGISTAVELIGERWALLIVRDLLVGPRRYSDLKLGLPKIPTNILSARLKELNSAGIVERIPLHHGLAYRLTEYGKQLEDVILALGRWGFQSMGEPRAGEVMTPDSLTMTFRTAFQAAVASKLPSTIYDTRVDDFELRLQVRAGELEVEPLDLTTPDRSDYESPYLSFATDSRIHKLIAGELTTADAVASHSVRILSGDSALLERFSRTFHLSAAA